MAMPQCENCKSHLTKQYARVFGNRDNEVKSCLHCKDGSRIDEREIAGVDPISKW